MKNVGNSSRGRSQGVPKIFRAPMYRAHCAVIFAIAQLSCDTKHVCDGRTHIRTDGIAVAALRCGKAVQMHCQFVAMHCQLHCLYFRIRKQKLCQ